ncbi:hypothetical protein [Spiroplasma attinicola]|nr:hypothetical protein [Spiroplasma sp. JKS002670]
MAGNCKKPCYGCTCSCTQAGTHPSCSSCRNCDTNDNHSTKKVK